jgi:cytochrome c peroxidase
MKRATIGNLVFVGVFFLVLSVTGNSMAVDLTPIELLGKYVFFDKLSNPARMSCSTCHDPKAGFTFGVSGVNLHQVAVTGADPHTAGNRKPPTNSYATFIGPFDGTTGGNFWDGRAEGNILPDPQFREGATRHIGQEVFYTTGGDLILVPAVSTYAVHFGGTADQALNPIPNPVEQNLGRLAVCQNVASSKYALLYEDVWGVEIDCSETPDVAVQAPDVLAAHDADPDVPLEKPFDISFKRLMLAVCAYQGSSDVNSFSCKLDAAIAAGEIDDTTGQPIFPLAGLTDQENRGHDLFYQSCAVFCHNNGRPGTDVHERYTSDLYFNIGTPANPEIPGFDPGNPDLGLYKHTGREGDEGKFKVPTMRNVDKRPDQDFIKAYAHNGWFKSLESIVHFYNTRDVLPRCDGVMTEKDALKNNCWPAPEVDQNVFPPGRFIGNIGLTPEDEADIVAYLKTLTDTYTAKQPKPYK